MSGIVSYGAYIPMYRLDRSLIAKTWKSADMGGSKSVANCDEDSVTMAVAAGIDCIGGLEAQKPSALFFATTTSPYREKQSATIIASALDLPTGIRTVDFTNSLRCGTSALNSALDAVNCNPAINAMVIASDSRLGAAHSEAELLFGDGAAAIMIGNSNVIATIEGTQSIFNELLDVWRANDDGILRSGEQRFIISKGYMDTIQELVGIVLRKYNLKPNDFSKIILPSPDFKSYATLAKNLGFNLKTQVQDPLISSIGNTGSASTLMMLIAALEEGKTGDKILFINYGDGADAFVLRITDEIHKLKGKLGIKGHLKSKATLAEYERYANWRNLIMEEGAKRPIIETPSVTCLWREKKRILALMGSKCKYCGTVQYPPQRVCAKCQTKDDFEDYKLSSKQGKVVTYAIDYLTITKDPPSIFAWIDFDGGGRIHCEITDHALEEPSMGMPVEMTFRRLYEAGGIVNYFWKARPIR